jgi:hypothetical protein
MAELAAPVVKDTVDPADAGAICTDTPTRRPGRRSRPR